MAEVMPDWYVVLMCGGLAALLGFSVLLCVMILDDRCDAAAGVLALCGGGDHENKVRCWALTVVSVLEAACTRVITH